MHHPKHAKVAYEGTIFKVYAWPQELFDGTTATFEAVARQATTTVIAEMNGEIIYSLQEQPGKPPFVSLFGGRVEWGEDPLEGAKRELLEESGLESDDWELLFETQLGGKIDWASYYYIARNCRKVADIHLDAGEKIEILRTPVARFFEDILAHPKFRDSALQRYFHSAFNQPVADAFMDKLTTK